MRAHLAILASASVAAAQASAWGQCGGTGYTGATTCVSGYSCIYINDWYSQCQPGGATKVSSTTTTSTTLTTSSSSTKAPTSTTTTTSSTAVPTGDATFRYLGRVNPATNELTWSGTGIAFTFTGTSAVINLASVTGDNSVDLIIDGGAPTVISSLSGTSISTPAGLSQGTHTVELRKRSEVYFGSIVIDSVTTDGTLVASTPPTRQIQVIGDSITTGYGLDGTNPCTNSAALENSPATYAALAADALSADYSIIAWSGKGIIRNLASTPPDTSALMPQIYTQYGGNDAANTYPFPSTWTPDAVVINLGTNDFGYLSWYANGTAYNARDPIDASAYTTGIVDFVGSIQEHYPDAEFFLLSSPMLSDTYPTAEDAQHTTQSNALKDAVEQIGEKAHFVDWPVQGADVGCDYHPNAATHAAQAVVLADAIGTVMGW